MRAHRSAFAGTSFASATPLRHLMRQTGNHETGEPSHAQGQAMAECLSIECTFTVIRIRRRHRVARNGARDDRWLEGAMGIGG